jgi:hypothetical protein
MGDDLVTYIDQQLRAGYNVADLKTYLTQAGYSQSQVDQAFSQLDSQYSQEYYSTETPTSQPQNTAAIYREQMQNMGYPEEQIDAYLKSQGLLNQKPQKKDIFNLTADLALLEKTLAKFNISLKTFFILCGGLFCIIVMVTALIMLLGGKNESTPPQVYNYDEDSGDTTIDDDNVFDDDYDDDDTSTDIEDDIPAVPPDDIGDDIPDDFTFDDDGSSDNTGDNDYIPPPADDPVDTTDDVPPNDVPDNTGDDFYVDDSQVGGFEVELQEVLSIAAADPMTAKQRCEGFGEQIYSDECFYQLTTKTDNVVFCSYVTNNAKHDRCLLNYAMKFNDFTRCAQYKTDLKTTCEEISGG